MSKGKRMKANAGVDRSTTGRPAVPSRQDLAVRSVLARYPFETKSIRLVSDKGKKAVWAVETSAGDAMLKKVPFDEAAIRFMIAAIDYMRGRGLGTPRVHRTADGNGWVAHEGGRYVLFESIRGRPPKYRIAADDAAWPRDVPCRVAGLRSAGWFLSVVPVERTGGVDAGSPDAAGGFESGGRGQAMP